MTSRNILNEHLEQCTSAVPPSTPYVIDDTAINSNFRQPLPVPGSTVCFDNSTLPFSDGTFSLTDLRSQPSCTNCSGPIPVTRHINTKTNPKSQSGFDNNVDIVPEPAHIVPTVFNDSSTDLQSQCRSTNTAPLLVPHPVQPAAASIAVDAKQKNTCFTVNLSRSTLTSVERALLDRGLTFIPTFNLFPLQSIYSLQNRLVRNLKLKDYYRDNDTDDDVYDPKLKTFTARSTWTPADEKISSSTLDTVQKIVSTTEDLVAAHRMVNDRFIRLRPDRNNLSADERLALKNLRANHDLIIKPADKGSATVVIDRDAYVFEGQRQLNNVQYYRKLSEPMFPDNVPRINAILTRMNAAGYITDAQLHYLSASISDRQRRFYLLPKIHKPRQKWPQPDRMPEGRPIVSDTGSESYRVAEYIDSFLKPISVQHPSYLKDTYDFVSKVRHQCIPSGSFLVTGDVTSLYTNMNHDRILSVVGQAFQRYPNQNRSDRDILDLLDLTLRTNDFVFNNEIYLQICGTAMGKVYAPSLADLYLEDFDRRATTNRPTLSLYFRFLDDIFFVWCGNESDLHDYGEFLNTLIPGITVTLNWSRISVDFLDTTVYVSPLPCAAADVSTTTGCDSATDPSISAEFGGTSELLTRIYFKSTDTHQLLHKRSYHPKHTCRGVLKSQFLRFKRISSSRTDYNSACKILIDALATRHYSRRMMREMKLTVWRSSADFVVSDTQRILPVIVPFNSFGCELGRRWIEHIRSDEFFSTFRIITAYTVGDSLLRKLVHSLLTSDGPTTTRKQIESKTVSGCLQCTNTRCAACNYIDENRRFSSCTNRKSFPVRGRINCSTANVVYLATCTRCNLQYVGETSRPLSDRINNHLSSIRLHKPQPLSLHINLPGHSLRDLRFQGIECFRPGTTANDRKTKETTWQDVLQTAYPLGLNNLKPKHLQSAAH